MSAWELGPWALSALLASALTAQHLRGLRMRDSIRDCAHELARPLAALRLGLGAVARGLPVDAEALDGEVLRAASALGDLRGLADRAAGDRSEQFDPAALVSEIARAWGGAAAAGGRSLSISSLEHTSITADRLRVGQAVTNLIANSLEHGAGTVSLAVTRAAGNCRIEVSDEGAGPTRSTPGTAARVRGRGRGLRIASRSIGRNGGRLVADGSSVIELPLDSAR